VRGASAEEEGKPRNSGKGERLNVDMGAVERLKNSVEAEKQKKGHGNLTR